MTRTAKPGVSRTALAAAVTLHAALATAACLVHSAPPATQAVEQVVQIAFAPAAVATPKEAEAEAVPVTEPDAVAASEPEAAPSVPELVAPDPVAPEPVAPEPAVPDPVVSESGASVALDQPDDPPLPEPVAAPPVAAPPAATPPVAGARTVETPREQPAETAMAKPTVDAPSAPSPAPPVAQRQPQPPAARPVATPQVAFSRGIAVRVPQRTSVSRVAAEAGTVKREAAQGVANDADQEASLEARIRDAVQAAVRYPAAARMMEVTGRARVQLDYRDGSVNRSLLAQSSGTPMLDQAALNAAQGAHYPGTPPALAGRLMRFLVWVEFRVG